MHLLRNLSDASAPCPRSSTPTHASEPRAVEIDHAAGYFWKEYVETIDQYASSLVAPLSPNQKRALWLQTQEGIDWLCKNDRESDAANVPFDDLAIAELIRDRVLDLAVSSYPESQDRSAS